MRITHTGSLVAILLVLTGTAAIADEPAEAEMPRNESTSDALMRSLLGDDPLDVPEPEPTEPESSEDQDAKSPGDDVLPAIENTDQNSEYARLARQLRTELEAAQAQLSQGQTGKQAQAAQAEAIATTERLIELAKQSASSSSNSESNPSGSPSESRGGSGGADGSRESAESQPAGMREGTSQQMAGNRNRQGKAEESSQRPVEQRDPAAVLSAFRTTVIERSWGHLPERMRARLLNGGGDRTLPRYETLVNRYYESLVRPDPEDSLNNGPTPRE